MILSNSESSLPDTLGLGLQYMNRGHSYPVAFFMVYGEALSFGMTGPLTWLSGCPLLTLCSSQAVAVKPCTL